MAIYQFSSVAGSSINFSVDPAAPDLLTFDAAYNAAQMTLLQMGADVRVEYSVQSVTLLGITISQLLGSHFSFADGSVVQMGTAGADILTGSDLGDYIDISAGGADSVVAGGGFDAIYVSAANLATSSIDGGLGGGATVHLMGGSPTPVVLSPTSLTNVGYLVLETAGALNLQLNDANVASTHVISGISNACMDFIVDGTALPIGSDLTVDGATQSLTSSFSVNAGAGNDSLVGGAGDDFLSGGSGSDILDGGTGNDKLLAGEGSYWDGVFGPYRPYSGVGDTNTLNGGLGDDTLYGDKGTDTLNGGDGNDVLFGGDGADILDGGAGNDILDGNFDFSGSDSNSDTLLGGVGDDVLVAGGLAADILDGGDGNDMLKVPSMTGYDLGLGGLGAAHQLTGGLGADTFQLRGAFSYETLTSSVAAPVLITDFDVASGDRLDIGGVYNWDFYTSQYTVIWRGTVTSGANGFAADFNGAVGQAVGGGDVLSTLPQLWTWYDATNNKTVLYADRDRNFLVDSSDFRVEFNGAVNLDSNSFLALSAQTGTQGNDALTGTAGSDLILAQAGDDTVDGGDGEDVLHGGLGNDSLNSGANTTLLGGEVLYGEEGNDTLVGGEGSDCLYGGSGSDTLDGGNGSDTLYAAGGVNSDGTVAADVAGDTNILNGGLGNDLLLGVAGSDTLNGGDGNDELWGNDGNDILDGGAGDDKLFGQSGNNTLYGGAGNDQLGCDIGNDTYVFLSGDGQDLISEGGGTDTISFGAGILPSDITFTRNGMDMVIGITGTTDQITVWYWDYWNSGITKQIEQIQFADGTVWNSAFIQMKTTPDTVPGGVSTTLGLGIPGSVTGTIDAVDISTGGADEDWYQVSLTAGTTYRFDMASSVLDSGLRIYDSTGLQLDEVDYGYTGDTEVLYFSPGVSGAYYVSAADFWGGNGDYTLSAAVVADSVPGDVSTTLSLNISGVVASMIESADVVTGLADEDWYQISLTAGTTYQFGMTSSMLDSVLKLYDVLGAQVGVTVDFYATRPEIFTFTPGASGLYYASASDFGGGLGDYTLSAAVVAPDSISGGTSTTLSLNAPGSVTGTIEATDVITGLADEDWYQISLAVGTTYYFDMASAAMNGVLRLYDSTGVELAFANNGITGDPETLIYNPISSGLYFVSVADFSRKFGDYTLSIGGETDLVLAGTAGNNTLTGGLGDDTFDGGTGADTMTGGDGGDVYYVDHQLDQIIELVGGGIDSVNAKASHTLADNVENLFLCGSIPVSRGGFLTTRTISIDPDIDGAGNAGDNLLRGNRGDNRLDGMGGNDTLIGGYGADTLKGGAGADNLWGGLGADTFVLVAGEGGIALGAADFINDFEDGIDRIALGGGLQFADLAITQGNGVDTASANTVISANGEYLAVLVNSQSSLLAANDFVTII